MTIFPCCFVPISVQLLPLKWHGGAVLFSHGGDANEEWRQVEGRHRAAGKGKLNDDNGACGTFGVCLGIRKLKLQMGGGNKTPQAAQKVENSGPS